MQCNIHALGKLPSAQIRRGITYHLVMGMEFYLVGGAVRDRLLGLPVTERDWVVVGATHREMVALGFRPLDRNFPVFSHPETGEEYALARVESKRGTGYKGFEVDAGPQVRLEDDLRRRDLTINAMALSPIGELFDPVRGQVDLRARKLRHITDAFVEDPLRVLRTARFTARFAALGFEIATGTRDLLLRMAQPAELLTLTHSHLWRETLGALSSARPERYFEVLHDCGALPHLLPELDAAWAGGERAPTPIAALRASVETTSHPAVRFAVLVHATAISVGEADTRTIAERLCARLKPPREFRALIFASLKAFPLQRELHTRDPVQALAWIDRLDGFRRPERLHEILLVGRAIASGDRGQLSILDWLERAHRLARKVGSREVASQGLAGAELGAAIRALRLEAIARSE